jgi:glycosyltransferase involved in cell wall biosynthesis
VSEAVRRELIDHAGVAEHRIAVLHEFIRDDCLRPRLSSETCSLSGRQFVVGGSGFPSWRKGLLLWLQMAAALRDLLPPDSVEFRWVGWVDNDEARAARFHIRRLALENVVKFIPHTSNPTPHFMDFDLFAMTSWEDPCPLVVLENMALGTPVLCFADSGGAPEEVGDTGVIITDFDPGLMAKAAAQLATDPLRRAALGHAACNRVRTHFTASVQAPKLLEEMYRASA